MLEGLKFTFNYVRINETRKRRITVKGFSLENAEKKAKLRTNNSDLFFIRMYNIPKHRALNTHSD